MPPLKGFRRKVKKNHKDPQEIGEQKEQKRLKRRKNDKTIFHSFFDGFYISRVV